MVTNSRVDAYTKIIDALAKYYPADSNKIDLNLDKLDSEISFIYDNDDLDAKDGTWTDDEINARLDFEHDVDIQVDLSETVLNNSDSFFNISIYSSDQDCVVLSQIEILVEHLKNNKKKFEFRDLEKH
ncbi:unnamed protein product, partial [Brachionus calyciflorus]